MEKLFERHDNYVSSVPMGYIRGIMQRINWKARLIVIRGPKGVGKSTLMKQYIKSHFDDGDRHVLYCSADSNYFSTHSLLHVAESFVKIGGLWLFIDEIHKYPGWSREIKEIYDLFPELHIVLSGSSLLQINDGDADLSRRIIKYDMPGLSFREFLSLTTRFAFDSISFEDLISNAEKFCLYVRKQCHPLEYFSLYLKSGYYPFWVYVDLSWYWKISPPLT